MIILIWFLYGIITSIVIYSLLPHAGVFLLPLTLLMAVFIVLGGIDYMLSFGRKKSTNA
jgi:hypothetical protein